MLDGGIRIHKDGEDIFMLAQLGCMSEYIVAPEASVVKIEKDIPLDRAALIGCAVMTGVGAAINTARVTPGANVAIFGAGGIGLSIIQGAAFPGVRE
jgi:S-(hydroxymethyl)glutathione dehydrogenase / alcohol dehydrogenase